MSDDFGREIAKAIITAQEIASRIPINARDSVIATKIPLIKPFPTPYQSKSVAAKTTETIYSWKIPALAVGFIQFVGCNMFENLYLRWYIDNVLVIEPYINWQIAPVNVPKQISPWLRVEKEIVWKAENKSDLTCLVEVMCDGFFCLLGDVPILRHMNLPVSLR